MIDLILSLCDVNLYNRELIRKNKENDLDGINNNDENKPTIEIEREVKVQNISLPNAKPGSHTSHTSHDVSTLSEKPNAIDTIENLGKQKPEKQIQLRHSSHAVIITNNDLDESKEDEELISSAKVEEGDNM